MGKIKVTSPLSNGLKTWRLYILEIWTPPIPTILAIFPCKSDKNLYDIDLCKSDKNLYNIDFDAPYAYVFYV